MLSNRYIFILFLGLFSCVKDKGPIVPKEGNSNTLVSYKSNVQPIFTQNCIACHNSTQLDGDLDLTDGNSYLSLVNIISYSYTPNKRVVPSNSVNSVLLQKINNSLLYGANMPISGLLSQQQISSIKKWIDEGALDN